MARVRPRVGTSLPSAEDTPLPFRWDITRREQLGTLPDGPAAKTCPDFRRSLLALAVRTVALSDGADLVFVGRSPESLYDLLSGLLAGASPKTILLRYSKGWRDNPSPERLRPEARAAFQHYLESIGLSPTQLVRRERPISLVDLLSYGGTYESLLRLLENLTHRCNEDWSAVRRKLRVVAIERDYRSLEPRWRRGKRGTIGIYRWDRASPWVQELLLPGTLKLTSVDRGFWGFLGNEQEKTTASYKPEDWGTDEAALPDRHLSSYAALRTARNLYEYGSDPATRRQFANLLTNRKEMRYPWLRHLVTQLRR